MRFVFFNSNGEFDGVAAHRAIRDSGVRSLACVEEHRVGFAAVGTDDFGFVEHGVSGTCAGG